MGFIVFREKMSAETFFAVGPTITGALTDAWYYLGSNDPDSQIFRIYSDETYADEIERNPHFQFSGAPEDAPMGAFVLALATDRLVDYYSPRNREIPRFPPHFYFNEDRGMYDLRPRG